MGTHVAICIQNGEYAGTLQFLKVYEVLEDSGAAEREYVRVIDESGEDDANATINSREGPTAT